MLSWKRLVQITSPVFAQCDSLAQKADDNLFSQVIHDDGSLLSCAINAACAALVDAGIPMTGLLTSVTIALAKRGDGAVDG